MKNNKWVHVLFILPVVLLLTSCLHQKIETSPIASEASSKNDLNPVTLTVYLTAHYANPDTHCPIYEKLLDYQKETRISQYSSYHPKRVILQSARLRFIS